MDKMSSSKSADKGDEKESEAPISSSSNAETKEDESFREHITSFLKGLAEALPKDEKGSNCLR